MRKQFSRGIMTRLEGNMPEGLKRKQLQILADLAAESFGAPKIRLSGTAEEALEQYAAFTCRCMEEKEADESRLFRDAQRLGSKIRKITGLTDAGDADRLIILLYQNIGIRMMIDTDITVSECYFSRFYTPEQCRIMSNVDSGIISGIRGGGGISFQRRITEGCDRCKACFDQNGEISDREISNGGNHHE